MLPMIAIGIRNQNVFKHRPERLQISEARRPHEHSMRIRGPVAHDVITKFSARRFDHLIHRTGRNTKAFGHDLEVIDQRLHLGLHFFAIGEHEYAAHRPARAPRHAVERLPHDANALPHLFHANFEARVNIVLGAGRNFEIKFLVAACAGSLCARPS